MAGGRDPRTGTVLAGYQIERLVGRGGMGVVYRAVQLRLNRPVALKVLAPEQAHDASFRERFERESQLAAAIEHQNILPVYDSGEAEGILYIAMRYVEGTDLKSLIEQKGAMETQTAFSILEQVAAALDVAHTKGLVHRDVKPGNILIAFEEPWSGHVYLADFGVARRTTVPSGTTLSGSGYLIGTPDYMAPEQIEARPLDGRADVYSLGVVLYQALTAALPFERDSAVLVLHAHLVDPPPRVSEQRPDLPPALDEVIARALAKAPGDRFTTCGELMAAARGAVERPELIETAVLAPPAETVPYGRPPAPPPLEPPTATLGRPRPQPWWRSRAALAGGAALVALAAGVGLYLALRGEPDGGASPPPSATEPQPPATDEPTPDLSAYETLTVTEDAAFPTWTSDGRLVYSSSVEGSPAALAVGNEMIPIAAKTVRTPSWSSSGIAYAARDQSLDIYLLSEPYSEQPEPVVQTSDQDTQPAWKPDGTRLAYSSNARSVTQGEDRLGWRIYIDDTPTDGVPVESIPREPGDYYGDCLPCNYRSPAWSSRDQIAFVQQEEQPPNNSDLWVMNSSGEDARAVFTSAKDERHPSWSPDGLIVFSSNCGGDYDLYVIDPEVDGEPMALTDNDENDYAPSWEPDGDRIAFVRGLKPDDPGEVWVIDFAALESAGALRPAEAEDCRG